MNELQDECYALREKCNLQSREYELSEREREAQRKVILELENRVFVQGEAMKRLMKEYDGSGHYGDGGGGRDISSDDSPVLTPLTPRKGGREVKEMETPEKDGLLKRLQVENDMHKQRISQLEMEMALLQKGTLCIYYMFQACLLITFGTYILCLYSPRRVSCGEHGP